MAKPDKSPGKSGRGDWIKSWLPVTVADLEETERRILSALNKTESKIMATEAEVIVQLKQVSQDLKDANTAIGNLQTEVGKVGTETDTLLQKVIDLQALVNQGGTISQELIDAVSEVAAQASSVKTGITSVAAATQAVDDKVPDQVVTPPPAA